MLPMRTLSGIVKQFYSSMVKVKPGAKVITIEPSVDSSSVKEAVRLFSMAFEQVCALKVVDKLVVSSLAHELMSAEVMTVFRRRNKRSGGASGT